MVPNDTKKYDMPDFSGVTGGASTTAKVVGGRPAQAEVHEIYEVVAGDSLSKIAKRKYGSAKLWTIIHEANKNVVKDPNVIQIGWKLRIPAKPSA